MSLRTRLIAGLLALAAVGLLLLAGVTYAEQRHFLLSRVDDQAKQAAQLDAQAAAPAGCRSAGRRLRQRRRPTATATTPADRRPRRPAARRRARGHSCATSSGSDTELGLQLLRRRRPRRSCPAGLAAGEAEDRQGHQHGQVLPRLRRDADATATSSFAAVPLAETERRRCTACCGSRAWSSSGILSALGALSWWLVRIGLRPLERIGVHRGRDRRRRPVAARRAGRRRRPRSAASAWR